MKKIVILSLAFAGLFSSVNVTAQSKSKAKTKATAVSINVPYTVANNYFVKNTFKQGMLKNAKIESQQAFDQFFGAAPVMGDAGKPTVIDFRKQYAIAVIPAATSNASTLNATSLKQSGKNITLTYSYKEGAKQSYTSQPFLLLVVDKKYDGAVKAVKS